MFKFSLSGLILRPNELESSIECRLGDIEKAFSISPHRERLFADFQNFILDFIQITPEFTIWLDGSFITKKSMPNDIDFVVWVDENSIKEHDSKIEKLENKYPHLDVYIQTVFAENTQNSYQNKLNYAYWYDLFSKTRVKTNKKQDKKAFLIIKIQKND